MTTHMTYTEFFLSILCHFEGLANFFIFLAKLVEFKPFKKKLPKFSKFFLSPSNENCQKKKILSPFVLK